MHFEMQQRRRRRRRVGRIFHSVGDFFHPRFLVEALQRFTFVLARLLRPLSIASTHIVLCSAYLKSRRLLFCIMHCIYFGFNVLGLGDRDGEFCAIFWPHHHRATSQMNASPLPLTKLIAILSHATTSPQQNPQMKKASGPQDEALKRGHRWTLWGGGLGFRYAS